MESLEIRDANPNDAIKLLDIYRPYVEDSAVSFEYEVPTIKEFKRRISETLAKFPYLVAEVNGNIAGYAYAGALRTRCAYGWSVEVTAYISPNYHRMGIGKALYENLFKILRKQGAVNAFAGITQPNDASVGLHESLGFKKIGIYKNIGFKQDEWWDVGWWQLSLQSPSRPHDLIPYSELK